MSLKLGNELSAKGLYTEAIAAYQKVDPKSPLRRHAEFNIRNIEKILSRESSSSAIEQSQRAELTALELPLLSIVMPVFNVAPYLDNSINSALSQRYQNFELIIVNDASTDNGKRIIEMYANEDERIRFINLDHNTLGGAGIPSNIGIRAAKGKYIAFIDSDDWVKPDAFYNLMQQAIRHDADLAIGNFCTFTEDDRIVSTAYDNATWKNLPKNKIISLGTHPDLLGLSPVPWRKLYKTKFLRDHDIVYPEGDYFYEDNPLHWHVLSKAGRVVVVDEMVSYHRMAREGQTMGSAEYKLSALCSHLNTILGYIKQAPIDVKPILFKELRGYLSKRINWVLKRQTQPSAERMIKKRLSQIGDKSLMERGVGSFGKDAMQKMAEYKKAYPDVDLTIVIPVFNAEDLLTETVESIMSIKGITFNVLAVDDGSSDGSLALLQQYEKKYPNFHVFTQGNKGAGRARNAVIPLITGEYTYFLDADDVIDGKALEDALALAVREDHDLVFVKYKIELHEDKKTKGMFNSDADLWKQLANAKDNETRRNIVAQLINYPWNRVIKTSLLHDQNIFFGATVVHNDITYHWHSILAAKNIGYTQGTVCTHRKFNARVQITNINDGRRMAVLDALRYTHAIVVRSTRSSEFLQSWSQFATHLLTWAEERIPNELRDNYRIKRQQFLEEIGNTIKGCPVQHSIPSAAIAFEKEGQFGKAAAIYDLLATDSEHPELHWKERDRIIAIMTNGDMKKGEAVQAGLHLKDAEKSQKWLRVAHWLGDLKNPDLIDQIPLPNDEWDSSELLIAKANACGHVGNRSAWLQYVNRYLDIHQMSPISLDDNQGSRNLFLEIKCVANQKNHRANKEPCVTVCMSCFNSEKTVEKAVRSLMQQSHKNLEIILFDDNSVDHTLSIIERLEKEDARIRVIRRNTNNGTYVNRNSALQQAKGEFFTVLDSDDVALPERIALQVQHLMENPEHVAVLTRWIRMDESGRFLFRDGWGGTYTHEAVATLMIRVDKVRNVAGYWDSVRFSADTEFFKRLGKCFGEDKIHLLMAPTCFALSHEDSLTRDPVTGIDVNGKYGWSPTRIEYAQSWRKWHAKAENLHMPFPLKQRPFKAPEAMLPEYVR
ncbi:glycosyltransferase family 2 protein [Corticibacter populi]|uniref:Glycosyltransferase family 2 protein n=1 Tax=Corticibacter populi TaxID=1550736 RepID=A0A3M6QLS9_9BURK|nr:glycosyltransferase family 2 protein [Corticibacter populi]RMX04040.1 glycosyltransferase family 2 protein [Corticibacter populi]RZS33038.1 glycosyltransferase involved in cell wall biosynthesis [Corticibacter populi]